MDFAPIVAQKSRYIMRLGICLSRPWPTDSAEEAIVQTSTLGQVTQSAYDELGRQVQVTDAAGQIMTYTYDAAGNRLTMTDANGNTTQTTYDVLNRPQTVADPLGHARTSVYDAVGNIVQVIDPLGNTTGRTYDALDRITEVTDALGNPATTTYDAEGRVLSMIDASGQTTTMAHDLLGRLVQVTDAAGGIVSYTYDAAGNRLSMTDPNGQLTQYAYDALNRRVSTTEALGHMTSVAFDAIGNRISRTDANGVTTQFRYDALNRLTAIDYPTDPDVALTYDAVGNRLLMADGLGTTSYTYDVLNRRTATIDPFGNTVQYVYDPVGNRTSLTYPDGKVVSYGYDAADRLISVTDWLANVTTYGYDADDRLVAATNANGTTVSYGYDVADRLTALSNDKSDSTVINAFSYTLDAVGNTISEDRTEPLAPSLDSTATNYAYDAENRLITINTTTNTFDANGNQTGKAGGDYSYDTANRLTDTTRGGITNSYGYDGLGNRYLATRDGVTTHFVLDTNSRLANVLVETDDTGTPQAYQVYGNGLIARILPNKTTLQYHYDSRGSTVAITDPSQAFVQQYTYDPFGRTVADSGSTDQPYRYLGQHGIQDEGGALSYIRARYYDADQQRFMSKDSYRGKDAQSQTMNRYIYALNNPVLLVDTSGYIATEVIRSTSSEQGASRAEPFVASLIDEQSNRDTVAMPDFSTAISVAKTLAYGIYLASKSSKPRAQVSAREMGEDDFKTLWLYKLCDADQAYDSFLACKASYATRLDETIIKVEGIESGASALGSCAAAYGTGGAMSAGCAKEVADFGVWSVKYKSGDINQPTGVFEAAGYATGNETLQKAGYYAEEMYFWGNLAGKAGDTYALGRQLDQAHVAGSSITDG